LVKAVVVEKAGGPEVLQLKDIPKPEPREGWVLVEIKAFGLNRSELFTRQGHSPSVAFPRVLGIECAGIVEAAPGTPFAAGQSVVAITGGMGRAFDGGYAEYTLLPQSCVLPIETELDWTTIGAIPEMFQTAYGSLTDALEVREGHTLLIRGGTSSVGMAAASLAADIGVTVIATTRNEAKIAGLKENGATEVIIDKGEIAGQLRDLYPDGVDRVLELIGATTLLDSLKTAAKKGIVCMTGILGGEWVLDRFEPLEQIPFGVRLTSYSGGAEDLPPEALQRILEGIKAGSVRVNLDRVFSIDEIVEAHRYMESNKASGKIVCLV
jgi:NADPH:quinone reductase